MAAHGGGGGIGTTGGCGGGGGMGGVGGVKPETNDNLQIISMTSNMEILVLN